MCGFVMIKTLFGLLSRTESMLVMATSTAVDRASCHVWTMAVQTQTQTQTWMCTRRLQLLKLLGLAGCNHPSRCRPYTDVQTSTRHAVSVLAGKQQAQSCQVQLAGPATLTRLSCCRVPRCLVVCVLR